MAIDMRVTVAIPTHNGAATLAGVLSALSRQTVEHELLICDSGSHDHTVALARSHGARVLELPPSQFNHGRTRNLLVAEARTERVTLLTQDAEPADERWLEHLLAGFDLQEDVGIVYGPYRPRPGASVAVRLELERWFASLSPDGAATVERLSEHERSLPVERLIGRRGFFTDANACIARAAWERVPFREVPYAEDRCSRSTCCAPATPRRLCPRPRCFIPTTTPPQSSCAAALTSGAACARCTAFVSPPRPYASRASCAASSARHGAS